MLLIASLPLIIASALAGCYATVKSSSDYLTPAQATVAIPNPVGALNTEIVRMFAIRNISLAEQHALAPSGATLLRFLGGRRHAGGEGGYGERHAIDSVYYVRVEPTARGATVRMIGKVAVDGAEACTRDPDFQLACSALSPPEALADSVDGYEEAMVVHNVIVQLGLEHGRAAEFLRLPGTILLSGPWTWSITAPEPT